MTVFEFISGFLKRKGNVVFFALTIEKAIGFLLVLIGTNLLKVGEYGAITYANTSLTFILPFVGMGIHQGLIRYGSISKSQQEKKFLFNIALKRGLFLSFVLWIIILIAAPFITHNLKDSLLFLMILSVQILSLYLLEIVKIYARLINRNTLFSKIVIVNSTILVVFIFFMTFFFEGIGYALCLALIPLFVAVWFIRSLRLTSYNKLIVTEFKMSEFVKYGLQISTAGVLSQLLYAVDILLIGNILQSEELIAQYKIANIIPFSFLFLPIVIMTSDFVAISRKSKSDSSYVKNYYLNYLKIFLVISFGIILFFYFFSENLYAFFGSQYSYEDNLMFVFSIGVVGALLFRVPLGNILSALGWSKVILVSSAITLVVNVFLSYYLLKNYGILGAAYATAFLMWFSGILFLIAFIKYVRNN